MDTVSGCIVEVDIVRGRIRLLNTHRDMRMWFDTKLDISDLELHFWLRSHTFEISDESLICVLPCESCGA